jgi:hypothetical protein
VSEAEWVKLEYESLREEILSLTGSQQSATRFFIPAASAVYTVPYLLKLTSQSLLWSVCAGGAALMVLAMSYTLLAYVEGIHKLGTYIAKAIEPTTGGGLRWETFLFKTQTVQSIAWPSEHVVISVVAVIANVAAASGAGRLFLPQEDAPMPALVAIIGALLTLPAPYRMWKSGQGRLGYADLIDATLRSPVETSNSDTTPPAG